jgi:hypothetical protein
MVLRAIALDVGAGVMSYLQPIAFLISLSIQCRASPFTISGCMLVCALSRGERGKPIFYSGPILGG